MEGINDLEKIHTESIDRILKETSEKSGKIPPFIHCTIGSDVFPKVKAAQIGGLDIDLEPISDKDGNIKYITRRKN